MQHRLIASATLALLAAPAMAATHTVRIEGMQFAPVTLTVKRGEQVVWVNQDLVPHTATAPRVFDSGTVEPGRSWKMTATRPGRYEYVCRFHPTMKATLVVE